MKWVDFVEQVNKKVKEEGADINTVEIGYIDLADGLFELQIEVSPITNGFKGVEFEILIHD